jgi:DNA mismatch repair ATPase MutS
MLRSNASIHFCCFDGEVIGGRVHYSYQLRDGISDTRFGMLLLREAHIPDLIAKIA